MSSLEIACQVCYAKYDNDLRIPRVLACGHTLCTVCIYKILDDITDNSRLFTCPFDKKKFFITNNNIENFYRNFALLQVIEDQQTSDTRFFCQIHKKRRDGYCLEDKTIICSDCANEPAHRGHKIQNKDEIRQKVHEKGENMKELVAKISDIQGLGLKKILALGSGKINELVVLIDRKAREYIDLIEFAKHRLKTEVTNYIVTKQVEADVKYQSVLNMNPHTKALLEWQDKARMKLNRWADPETGGIVPEMLDEQPDLIRENIREWEAFVLKSLDFTDFAKKMETLVLAQSEASIKSVLENFCKASYIENNVEEEEKHEEEDVKETHEEINQSDISFALGKDGSYKNKEKEIFLHEETFSMKELPRQKGNNSIEQYNPKVTLRKLFKLNRLRPEWKTSGNLESTIFLTEENNKKPSMFKSFFSKSVPKDLHKIRYLNIYCDKLEPELLKRLSTSLSSLSNLTSLKLDFAGSYSLVDVCNKTIIENLSPMLGRLTTLESLELNLQRCSTVRDEGISALSRALEKLQALIAFKLSLPRNGAYTGGGLLELSKGMVTLKGLRTLNITVPENAYIAPHQALAFCSSIAKLRLGVLHLDIHRIKRLTDADFKIFTESFTDVDNIKELRLALSLQGDSMIGHLTNLLSKLGKVSTLSLGVHDMKSVTEAKVIGMFQALGKLESLTKLHLKLGKWNIRLDSVFAKLGEVLSNFKALSSLNLQLKGCSKISKEVMKEFCVHFKKSTSLTELVFESDSNFNECLSEFSSSLSSLNKIQRLCLDVPMRVKEKDINFQALTGSIDTMKGLTHLELTFRDWLDSAHKSVLSLIKVLETKDKLTSLSLTFENCEINNKTLGSVSGLIPKLKMLSKIKLCFGHNEVISSEGVKFIASALVGEVGMLDVAHLDFEKCRAVSKEDHIMLAELRKLLEAKGVLSVNIM